MAIEQNITNDDDWFINEDKELPLTIYQADETTPQDVSGWALSFMLKRNSSDVTAKITKTTAGGGGITFTTPASGLVLITVQDTDTAALKAGTYMYEVKRTDDGSETVLTHGTVLLKQAVHL